jgi:hypothetical protein
MYQDVAGTSPVTADGQSVLLMLDKGQWGGKTLNQVLAAQAELVTNGDFSNGTTDWTAQNSSIAEVGGELVVTGSGGAFPKAQQTISGLTAGRTYLMTATARRGTTAANAYISPAAGVDGITSSTSATQIRAFFRASGSTATIVAGIGSGTGSGTAIFDNISFKEIPGYHRVQATPSQAPKYKTDGTLHWLLYDGTDDGNVTPTINWGTDEVAICAGITKSSDAASAMFVESSVSLAANNGTFALQAPGVIAADFRWNTKGTSVFAAVYNNAAVAAPTTNVLMAQGKIATDTATLRVDGVQVASSAADQGTGNYGNYPMYFGRRGGASLPFNGKEHSFVARSRLLSASELAKLETFVAAKTGVIL